MLKGAQDYSGIYKNTQGYSARTILEAPGGPKKHIFAYSSSGFTVFEKPRSSRKHVAKLLLRFREIRKCCFCPQVQCFLRVFLGENVFRVLFFRVFGSLLETRGVHFRRQFERFCCYQEGSIFEKN